MTDIENAKIDGTMLGLEDHGHLTLQVYFSGPAWGQASGGYAYETGGGLARQVLGITEAVGVRTWEELKGKLVRVRREGGRITSVGHYLNDTWHRFGP